MLCSLAYLIPIPSPYRLSTYPAPSGQQLLSVPILIVFLVVVVFTDVIVLHCVLLRHLYCPALPEAWFVYGYCLGYDST